MSSLLAYMPADRQVALARGEGLPESADGAILFADISGFTTLTNAYAVAYGPRHGAEQTTRQLNRVYQSLITPIHENDGCVISFSGDGMMCWIGPEREDGLDGTCLRAIRCARAMQARMQQFASLQVGDDVVALAMKAVIGAGRVHRYAVGDPSIQRIDVVAGAVVDRVGMGEQLAQRGDILVDRQTVDCLGPVLTLAEWRIHESGERFALLAANDDISHKNISHTKGVYQALNNPSVVQGVENLPEIPPDVARQWLLPAVYARLSQQQEAFLAELRPAVAMFLRFTGLEYDTDPAAGEKLASYIEWVQRTLDQYEGVLIQVTTGDKGSYCYAVFGAPVKHDDDVQRAVAAAMRLLSPPVSLSYQPVPQIGLAQGRMRVGAYGSESRRTYGVQGPAVNLAARIMMRARPGEVLVEEGVERVIRQHYRVESLGKVLFKGLTTPLPIYAIQGEQSADVPHRESIGARPLFGRDAELECLQVAKRVVDGGQGQIINVVGAAGVGKTRLVSTFLRSIANDDVDSVVDTAVQIVVTRCQSTSVDEPYHAARQFLWPLLGLHRFAREGLQSDADYQQEIERQVEGLFRALNPDWLVRVPLLGDVLGIEWPDNETTAAFSSDLRRDALTALIVDVVGMLSSSSPVVVAFEDADWMDEASRDLMLALARASSDAATLFLFVYRPPTEENQAYWTQLGELPNQTTISLENLTAADLRQLVGVQVEGNLSDLAADFLYSQSQGNPFFAEELVRALVERGRIVNEEGLWTLSPELIETLYEAGCIGRREGDWVLRDEVDLSGVDLGIPDSIYGMMLSRLDRLPESAGLTLKVASVIGRVFDLPLLAESHPLHQSVDDLVEEIGVLQSRELVEAESDATGLTYVFRQNTIQEVTYQTMLSVQRQELHRAIGGALERLAPDGIERLAYHFHAADLEQDEIRGKALGYLEQAAVRSRHSHTYATALSLYERMLVLEVRRPWLQAKVELLHLLGRRQEELETLEVLAEWGEDKYETALLWANYYAAIANYEDATAQIEVAQRLCVAQGNVAGEIDCALQLAEIAGRQGDYASEQRHYFIALDKIGKDERYIEQTIAARYGLGVTYRQEGKFREARREFEQALALSQSSHNRYEEARLMAALGMNARMMRDYGAALELNQRALTIRSEIGDRAGEGSSLLSLAQVLLHSADDYNQAEIYLQKALAIQRAVDNRWSETNTWNELGILYYLIGQWDNAATSLREALKLCEEIRADGLKTHILCNLGQVLRYQRDNVASKEMLLAGLESATMLGDRHTAAQFHSELAITGLELREYGLVIEQAARSLEILRELELIVMMTADLTTLAVAHLECDELETAADYVRQAFQILNNCSGKGPDFPHRDYFLCYRVFRAVDEYELMQQALESAHRLLLEQANRITDDGMRATYLSGFPVHQEILNAAGKEIGQAV